MRVFTVRIVTAVKQQLHIHSVNIGFSENCLVSSVSSTALSPVREKGVCYIFTVVLVFVGIELISSQCLAQSCGFGTE